MVAKVITGKNITDLIGYNEEKCRRGVAECLLASGFLKDETRLSRREKVTRFTRLTAKNQRSKTNALHVPISFSPEEKLSTETLSAIASVYMEKIGFGEQPFLVYLHRDTDIPHMHIVSTLIREDGKRIPVHNLGRNQSTRARRELEQEFGLVKAETRGKLKRMLTEPRREALKKMIDNMIASPSVTNLETFVGALKARSVDVKLHINAEGRTFGVTFYDRKSKTDFKGSQLGKPYGVNAILKRLNGRGLVRAGGWISPPSIPSAKIDWAKNNAGTSLPGRNPIVQDLIGDGRAGASAEATMRLSRRRKKTKRRRKM